MEWYIIAKIYNTNNNYNFIVHTGLYHSENIIKLLKKYYEYNILDFNGINTVLQAETYNYNGCITLPLKLEKMNGD